MVLVEGEVPHTEAQGHLEHRRRGLALEQGPAEEQVHQQLQGAGAHLGLRPVAVPLGGADAQVVGEGKADAQVAGDEVIHPGSRRVEIQAEVDLREDAAVVAPVLGRVVPLHAEVPARDAEPHRELEQPAQASQPLATGFVAGVRGQVVHLHIVSLHLAGRHHGPGGLGQQGTEAPGDGHAGAGDPLLASHRGRLPAHGHARAAVHHGHGDAVAATAFRLHLAGDDGVDLQVRAEGDDPLGLLGIQPLLGGGLQRHVDRHEGHLLLEAPDDAEAGGVGPDPLEGQHDRLPRRPGVSDGDPQGQTRHDQARQDAPHQLIFCWHLPKHVSAA